MKNILLIILLSVAVSSCQQKSLRIPGYDGSGSSMADIYMAEERSAARMDEFAPPPPPAPETPEATLNQADVNNKKIIKDGSISIKVTDINAAKTTTDSLIKKYDAYYASETFNNNNWESAFNLTIRIPANNFEAFIRDIESGKGEILSKNIFARDVTGQYFDLESRLENKKNYLTRYRDLLKQAKTIKEILDIEEKIRVLEEEIDSTVGQLKLLSDQIAYSTLTLYISKPIEFKYTPAQRDKFWESLKQSFSKGWFGFIDFLLFVIKLWPLWLIIILVVYTFKKLKFKPFRRKK